MEPARILRLLLCVVENATSITKKLIIKPMRSAKDTYQPCPPPCAAPRFFLAIAYFPEPVPARSRWYRLALFLAEFFRQVRQQNFPDRRSALCNPRLQGVDGGQS